MLIVLLGMMIAETQVVAPKGAPVEASYILVGGEDQVGRLLAELEREGAIKRGGPSMSPEPYRACIDRRDRRTLDEACIRRLLPAAGSGAPTVAILTRDSGRRNLVYEVSCLGPDGRGGVRIDPRDLRRPRTHRFALEARAGLARCLSAALRRSVRLPAQ